MTDKPKPTSYRWPADIKSLLVKLVGKQMADTGKKTDETEYLVGLIREEAKRQNIK